MYFIFYTNVTQCLRPFAISIPFILIVVFSFNLFITYYHYFVHTLCIVV